MDDGMDVDMEDAADDDARVRDDDDGGEDMMEVDAELVAMTLHELRCARAAIDGLSSPEDRGSCMPSNGDILPPPRSAFDRDDDDAGAAGAIVVVVPDTNVLVRHGGASVRMLRERFRSVDALAARVVVPRKVIEELDGLKTSSDDGGRRAEVAALARSVNRAIASALEENERATATGGGGGDDLNLAAAAAAIVVQGPSDARKMRAQMRAESGDTDGETRISGDDEIVYFCQAMRRRGERVALLTGDVNAGVGARSYASPDDVPIATFDPETGSAPRDLRALATAVDAFYARASAAQRAMEGTTTDGRAAASAAAAPPPPARDASSAAPAFDDATPETTTLAVLDALDAALPSAVETMLRDELGDMWACAVRDDDEDLDAFGADEAFRAFRKNHATFNAGRRVREGKDAMDVLAAARRARDRGKGGGVAGAAGFGGFEGRMRALEIVGAAREVLRVCPADVAAVAAAVRVADAARAALTASKLKS
jgi:hypothetical protein